MKIEVINPKNEQEWLALRVDDLTSTDIAALFGLSPYLTPFELWHRKKDKISVSLTDNDRLKWGRRNQDTIAAGFAEDHGWEIRKMTEYIRKPELRLGSSFDFCRLKPSPAILEVKNVDALEFLKGWTEDDTGLQAPYHIELQIQHQLLVSELPEGYICCLVGGNKPVLIHRTDDQKIQDAILLKAAEFWKSIDDNNPPAPNFENDAEFINHLLNYAEPGKVIDISEDEATVKLGREYIALKEVIKMNSNRCEAIKAEILTRIGDAEKIIAPTFSISAGTVGPVFVEAFERKAYRNFRVNTKKEK